MRRKRIIIASPVEPSGGSWLLNCLLELGIKVGHKPVVDRIWRGSTPRPGADHIWTATDDGGFALNPKAAVLLKFLPILTRQTRFAFREDIDVEYVQDFPVHPPQASGAEVHGDHPVMLMVRDPRDAIYSMYRRIESRLSFDEFLRFPHHETLLDCAAHWTLFIAAWLGQQNVHAVRFEDYKHDAAATLRAMLNAAGLDYDEERIAQAVAGSSFERARDAERLYHERFPGDRQIANRAGQVGEGLRQPDIAAAIPAIEREASSVMRHLGYEPRSYAADQPFAAARAVAQFLPIFATLDLPAEFAAVPLDVEAAERTVLALLTFARRLDAGYIERAALPPEEARTLHDSLILFTRNHAAALAERLATGRAAYADGSAYFFERIRVLRSRGRPAAS